MAGTSLSVPLIDKSLLLNQSVLNTASPGAEVAGCEALVFNIVGSAGVASGAVQIEEAQDVAYAGTWSAIGAPVTVVANATIAVHQLGTSKAVRARISTVIAGGTVSVYITGR